MRGWFDQVLELQIENKGLRRAMRQLEDKLRQSYRTVSGRLSFCCCLSPTLAVSPCLPLPAPRLVIFIAYPLHWELKIHHALITGGFS